MEQLLHFFILINNTFYTFYHFHKDKHHLVLAFLNPFQKYLYMDFFVLKKLQTLQHLV